MSTFETIVILGIVVMSACAVMAVQDIQAIKDRLVDMDLYIHHSKRNFKE